MTPLDKCICERCEAVAQGAIIESPWNGLCFDTQRYADKLGLGDTYERLSEVFTALGLDEDNPIGDDPTAFDLWKGERGKRRRKLAADVAKWLRENAA